MNGSVDTAFALDSDARNADALKGLSLAPAAGKGDGTGAAEAEGRGVGGCVETGLGSADELGVECDERKEGRACGATGEEFVEDENRDEDETGKLRMEGVGVPSDAASAGVGINVLRYRCKGANKAVVRAEKCCRRACEASSSIKS